MKNLRYPAILIGMKRFLGGFLLFSALLFFALGLSFVEDRFFEGKRDVDIGLIVFCVAVAGISGYGGIRLIRRKKARSMPKGSGTKLRETMVLQFAKESGGIVTVGELASATGIPLDDAKLMLEKMVSQGAADTEISQSGGLRYIFPGFTAKEGRSV